MNVKKYMVFGGFCNLVNNFMFKIHLLGGIANSKIPKLNIKNVPLLFWCGIILINVYGLIVFSFED